MALEIINCEQGTEEWLRARMGIPTASEFKTVLAGGEGKTRRKYMLKLLGERLTGEMAEGFSNRHTERGHEMEPEAREAYAFIKDVEPELVGFVRNGEKGASPDSFIGSDGCLEIKSKLPHLQLDLLLRGEVPIEHMAQIQGQLWVCEREWCDFVSYWPKLDPFIKRVYRDEEYIKKLSEGVERFIDELLTFEARFAS